MVLFSSKIIYPHIERKKQVLLGSNFSIYRLKPIQYYNFQKISLVNDRNRKCVILGILAQLLLHI